MTSADNIRRLDDAMSDHGQPLPINKADLRAEAEARRSTVLDRLAVVRVNKTRNGEQIADLQDQNIALDAEAAELEMLADAMLSEIHAFDRIGQGRV